MSSTRNVSDPQAAGRSELLHAIARGYVTEGLGKKNFEAIPYSDDVVLRAPLCPGGPSRPLSGRENLRHVWWPGIPPLVAAVRVIETYVNRDLTSSAVEFHLTLTQPRCTLRVLDRFTINAEGEIFDQENFFDPRDATDPGWQEAATPAATAPAGSTKAEMVAVVEAYINGFALKSFKGVPFAEEVSFESPLSPRLTGEKAIEFLTGLFAAIRGVRIRQHIVEGDYVATVFDLDTIHGTVPVFDRFRVVDGRLQEIRPFYDPTPLKAGAVS